MYFSILLSILGRAESNPSMIFFVVAPAFGELTFGSMRMLAHVSRMRGAAAGFLLPLCWGVCAMSVTPAANAAQVKPALSAPIISPFAVADFDGDSQLDIATVQTGQFGSLETKYWIHFQLSSGPRQFILVTAPSGGLHIVPRDVNGDNALDLVVTTAAQHQPVAVLLNDGRGNFTAHDPGQFSASFREPLSSWAPTLARTPEAAAAMLARNPSARGLKLRRLALPGRQRLPFFRAVCCQPPFARPASIFGRAPPAAALRVNVPFISA
jgi:hypothetical protein